jgi:hypothetical protein
MHVDVIVTTLYQEADVSAARAPCRQAEAFEQRI